MQKTLLSTLITMSVLLAATNSQAGTVSWSDPLPNTPAVKADAEKGIAAKASTGGIGYEWSVTLGGNDSAEITGAVGAKSMYEPTFKAPEFSWQHTTNWIALDLTADASINITVAAQEGVTTASLNRTTNALEIKAAGNKLKPAVVIYKNWEESGVETGSFNPLGKTSWANEIAWIGAAYADKGQTTITTGKLVLPKGKYSLVIGGVNAYAPNGCPETDATCFTGNHGYRATIVTTPN